MWALDRTYATPELIEVGGCNSEGTISFWLDNMILDRKFPPGAALD